MSNLNMFGTTTPTPEPSTSGGAAGIANSMNQYDQQEEFKKMLEQDDEDILLILSQFIIKNN